MPSPCARDLNWTQALNVVLALANQQYFTLDESVFDQFTATRTTDGTITVTPPAEPAANAGNCDASNGRFAIRPATIRGVQFVYFDQWTREGDIQHSATQAWLTLLDPRFLVLLTWLCERLRSNWGATTLYHTGILGHGVTNCHRWGRAIDFAGVGGQVGWGSYVINVFKHWGKQPVTMPSDWGPINPATKKPKYQQGQELPQWPDQFEDTTYRLALPDDPDQFLAKVFKMPPSSITPRASSKTCTTLPRLRPRTPTTPTTLPRPSAGTAATSFIPTITIPACVPTISITSTSRLDQPSTPAFGRIETIASSGVRRTLEVSTELRQMSPS